MDNLRTVLVGVDFTPGSAAALHHALRLARANAGAPARVVAVHVINTHVVIGLQHALSPMQKDIQRCLDEEARRQWMMFAPDATGKDAVELVVRVGNPAVTLVDEAAHAGADLVVLGLHREAGAESGAGTVAGACVRGAKGRVLLVRADRAGPYQRVVAGVDFTPASAGVVVEAARVARADGAPLDIVHVFEPPWRQLHYFVPMPENTPEFQAGYRSEMTAKLREFCEPLKGELAGITHRFQLDEHQSAGRGLVEYATKNGADLVVLGTRERSGLKELVLGSTAERLLRQTPCSMMTVRPPAG
jgi:nucleotide-binding universal stress UspA family protein